jgi:hypothetical protein
MSGDDMSVSAASSAYAEMVLFATILRSRSTRRPSLPRTLASSRSVSRRNSLSGHCLAYGCAAELALSSAWGK